MFLDVVILLAAGAAVWWAGTTFSRDADALAASTGIERVVIGAVLLGLVTSLPEIATTVTAGVLENPRLATGNLMGGVALQVVVLAVADVVESDRPLMFQVSKPAVLVQHVAVMVLLAVVIAGMAAGEPFTVAGVGVWPFVLVAVYAGSLWVLQRLGDDAAWAVIGQGPTLGHGAPDADGSEDESSVQRPPTWRLVTLGAVILVAGWLVAQVGDSLSEAGPVSGTFVGAALVALTTSLPEVSTVLGSLRAGSYDMAVANIVGTNGIEVALVAVADVSFRGGAVLEYTGASDMFLAALAATLTGIYLGALLVRSERTVLRVGYGSAAVILVYLGGLGILATMD